MSSTQVDLKIEGSHATIMFRTDGGMNILSADVLHSFGAAVAKVKKNSHVRTTAIQADGKVFIAGADIKEMANFTPDQARTYGELGEGILNDLAALPCITVAAIQGAALGGGLELALACDFRLAVKSAKLGFPEVSLGLIPGWGGILRVNRLIGPSHAKKLFLTANPVSGEDALGWGLVDEMVNSPEDLNHRVMAFCRSFRRASPAAVALAKRAARDFDELSAFAECFAARDSREGMTAFVEKRPGIVDGRITIMRVRTSVDASASSGNEAEGKTFVGPEDLGAFNPTKALGEPGSFPYTRGVHRTMYRDRLWTMRQFAGFGSAEDTNGRFKYLLEHGQTGLSTAFDLPTLMGRDSDDPLALGEVGRCGVAISSLADMRRLFDGIDLGAVSTSMTINAPAAILLAFYVAVGQEQGVPLNRLRGTLQNDILKEFHAQNEYVFPPAPSVKLVVDTIEYCTKHLPQWNTVSISGYHIREAGATAAQELAFTLADGIAYVEASIQRGLAVDDFAPRLSFFFDVHNDFFEEIAKLRAARRIWAHVMRDRFKAKQERSWLLRMHCQTAGVTLTEQQPMNNVVRVAFQALAGVLGGTQSLHTNSMDETLALPTEEAAKLALRTQQIIAHETNVNQTVDPLGGSYFVEKLTNEIEATAYGIFDQIDAMGGVLKAIDRGYFRRAIAESSLDQQRELDRGGQKIVGVTDFVEEGPHGVDTLKITQETEDAQIARLKALKQSRDKARHRAALERLRRDAQAGANVMPALIEAAEADATVGEMMDTMKSVFGAYDGGPEW